MNTGKPKQDQRSLDRLMTKGVDERFLPLLEKCVKQPDCPQFIVTETMRTQKRQIELLAAGASRTLQSKHLIGKAFDVAICVNGEVRWDWPLYAKFAVVAKRVAAEHALPLIWGGDWKKFKDGPHFELVD